MAKDTLFSVNDVSSRVYAFVSYIILLIVVFLNLSLFYRLAPRRPTRFAEVWAASLCASLLLQAAESLFVIYLRDYATFNAVYGAFGGIMALLVWILLSGCILILGDCMFMHTERSFHRSVSSYQWIDWSAGTLWISNAG